ncbi:MAG TPA: SUMF1/EgtB/PvdO family nonheme iron enzyme [Anaerolineales bacterium]|nr:SUMF1/EgtB/PvdO family nonheme iron enzyme [Anaerolineales bacterium]
MRESEIALYVGKDHRPMVVVPAGEFLAGEDRVKVSVAAFYIDRFPVTNADYKKFVETTHWEEPAHWRRSTWPEGKADHPVVQVNWDSAVAYAQWAGKRLPTEEEWEKAARGTDGRVWPWGSTFVRDRCNTSETEIWDTTPVGNYSPGGDSPYGVADMAGNVWEWIGGKPSPLRMPLRGGDWLDDAQQATTYYRRMHTPKRKNDFVGFRCAADGTAQLAAYAAGSGEAGA